MQHIIIVVATTSINTDGPVPLATKGRIKTEAGNLIAGVAWLPQSISGVKRTRDDRCRFLVVFLRLYSKIFYSGFLLEVVPQQPNIRQAKFKVWKQISSSFDS
jgi:hypothetical protein